MAGRSTSSQSSAAHSPSATTPNRAADRAALPAGPRAELALALALDSAVPSSPSSSTTSSDEAARCVRWYNSCDAPSMPLRADWDRDSDLRALRMLDVVLLLLLVLL